MIGDLQAGKQDEAGQPEDKASPTLRPTLHSVLALLLLALGAIASHLILSQSITKLEEDSLIINTSGRQRMLSEQTFRLAGELSTAVSDEEAQLVREQLRSSVTLMRESHEQLVADVEQKTDIPAWDEKLTSAYFDGDPSLDARVRAYLRAMDSLLSTAPEAVSADLEAYDEIAMAHRQGLLADLNKVVTLYEGKAQARLAASEWLHVYLMLAMLALLAFVAAFIFRPLVKRQALANQQLRAARDKAQSELAARAGILAAVSHEIRTPLGGVLGIIDQLKRERSPVERGRALDLVEDSCEALLETLDAILQQSRLGQGADSLSRKRFSPRSIAQRVAELFRPVARRKALAIEVSVSSDQQVLGDAARIQQVLANLVSNSVKFTRSGSISISVKEPGEGSKEWSLQVADTGSGMDRKRVEGLFQPFGHSSDDTLGRAVGAGLGLSITRDLVKAMGGRIEVESEPGKGSVFTVFIPLEAAASKHHGTAASAETGCVVLLIDRASDRVQAEAIAVQSGFDVVDLDAGEEVVVPDGGPLIAIVDAGLRASLSESLAAACAQIILLGDPSQDAVSQSDGKTVYVSQNQLARSLSDLLERPTS